MTVVTRRTALALGLLSLLYLWDHPRVRPLPALAVALGYLAFHLVVTRSGLLKGPRRRTVKVAQDLADALAIGLGAAFSGGLTHFLSDQYTIAGSNLFTQDLHVFENRGDLSLRGRFSQRKGLMQLVSGSERSYVRERSVRVRIQLVKEIANQTEFIE